MSRIQIAIFSIFCAVVGASVATHVTLERGNPVDLFKQQVSALISPVVQDTPQAQPAAPIAPDRVFVGEHAYAPNSMVLTPEDRIQRGDIVMNGGLVISVDQVETHGGIDYVVWYDTQGQKSWFGWGSIQQAWRPAR